jgi:hypothetical protein
VPQLVAAGNIMSGDAGVKQEKASMAGKLGGTETFKRGKGMFAATPEQRSAWAKLSGDAIGSRLGKDNVKLQRGIYAMSQEELFASRGRGGKTRKGTRWWNNGKIAVRSANCPEGFVSGMLKKSTEF